MKSTMPLPVGKRSLAPEADLRSIIISRGDRRVAAGSATAALAQSELAEGLFFAKGGATAKAFRPANWTYGDMPDAEADAALAAANDRTAGRNTGDGATGPPANADEAAAKAPGASRAKPDAPCETDDLASLERTFIESQLLLLTEEAPPEGEGSGAAAAEPPLASPMTPDPRPPEADLRTVQLRRPAIDAPLVDGLFVRKGPIAADATPAQFMPASSEAVANILGRDMPTFAPEMHAPVASRSGLDGTYGPAPAAASSIAVTVAIGKAPPRTRRRGPFSLAPAPVAIVVFGFLAVLLSSGLFILSKELWQRDALAVRAPQAAAAPAKAPNGAGDDFLARGDDALKIGDVFAARLYYKRAADAGSALGAFMVGATFDPAFLASMGVRGFEGDGKAAWEWYHRARDLDAPAAPKPPQTFPHK
jgi:hypothetical protein